MSTKKIFNEEGFIFDSNASYKICDVKKYVLYDYNLFNSEILVKLNKFGINCVQYQPPGDVMLLNTNNVNHFSKWNLYIKQDNGSYINNFSFPRCVEPNKTEIIFKPEVAIYTYCYDGFEVQTKIFIHNTNASVIMQTTIKNLLNHTSNFDIIVSVNPYLNPASLALWDKPEWYVKTALRKKDGFVDFYSKLFNPQGDVSKRRLMTFAFKDEYVKNCEVDMSKYIGLGDFFNPYRESEDLSLDIDKIQSSFDLNVYQEGFPSVYAAKLHTTIDVGEKKVFSQVLSIQDKSLEGEFCESLINDTHALLSVSLQEDVISKNRKFYDDLFSIRNIQTNNKEFDYFVNGFLPLQLYWVSGLDRGWPTGMQGTRDSAVDFEGMVYYNPEKSRKQLVHLFSCMRSDGWSLRQVSTKGKNGVHDTRFYCDSTAFVQEFLYEYVCATDDYELLNEKTTWLDNDTHSTILEHYLKGFDFYLDEKNIGEHGLCKLYAGDWLDPLNQAGMQGRGESVMVSCMLYFNLNNAAKLLSFLDEKKYKLIIDKYNKNADLIKENINKFAYNKKGFYNGMFSDAGFWIFSEKDPDEKERIYSSANYFAISSGVANDKQTDSVLQKTEQLKCSCGYRLFAPSFTTHLDYVGRVASGDMPDGLWENGGVYNHGGNCFRARALAKAHRANELFETIMFILPFDKTKHSEEISGGSPYGIVNCYQTLKHAYGKAGSPFLSGSVAMSVRIIFSDLFGVNFDPTNIIINPCLTKEFSNSIIKFSALGKNFFVKYIYGNGDSLLNDKVVKPNNNQFIIDKNNLKENNFFEIYYE